MLTQTADVFFRNIMSEDVVRECAEFLKMDKQIFTMKTDDAVMVIMGHCCQ